MKPPWRLLLLAPPLRLPIRPFRMALPPPPPPSEPDPQLLAALQSLTIPLLQQRLRARNLRVSGRKDELIRRLATAGEEPALPPPPPAAEPIPRDSTPPPPREGHGGTLRLASWNVAGLRGLLKRQEGVRTLRALLEDEAVDVLLLQETKLQEHHVAEAEAALLGAAARGEAWRAAWACSTARKGYAGVCTMWRAERHGGARAVCAPWPVDEAEEAGREGRTLLLQLPLPSGTLGVVNVYTPNAGAELGRLAYRTEKDGWDCKFARAVEREAGRIGGRVVVGGDLNVAAEDIDFWNPADPRTRKQEGPPRAAGTTPEERESFRGLLRVAQDSFRLLHPDAAGQYTYWSQRARNRPRNRGLRIDYFLTSTSLPKGAIVNSQILHSLNGSDHCPILLELDLSML
ncbi:hypothetical protein AB1Y20_018228 [Prymnesium parvum]|uniref:DNA-(apurinic or apyrimidinic site) endonuclease n=1 Tax=Prymnesium parvum TaxID=97485 RepID=A0AB34JNB7_PRYPA